jgi:hypothetical protein
LAAKGASASSRFTLTWLRRVWPRYRSSSRRSARPPFHLCTFNRSAQASEAYKWQDSRVGEHGWSCLVTLRFLSRGSGRGSAHLARVATTLLRFQFPSPTSRSEGSFGFHLFTLLPLGRAAPSLLAHPANSRRLLLACNGAGEVSRTQSSPRSCCDVPAGRRATEDRVGLMPRAVPARSSRSLRRDQGRSAPAPYLAQFSAGARCSDQGQSHAPQDRNGWDTLRADAR